MNAKALRQSTTFAKPPPFRPVILQLTDYFIAIELFTGSSHTHGNLRITCLVAGAILVLLGLATSGPFGLTRRSKGRYSRVIPASVVALALLAAPGVWNQHLTIVAVLVPIAGGVVLLRVATRTRRTRALPLGLVAPGDEAAPVDTPRPTALELFARRQGRRAGAVREDLGEIGDKMTPVVQRATTRGARRLGKVIGRGNRVLRGARKP